MFPPEVPPPPQAVRISISASTMPSHAQHATMRRFELLPKRVANTRPKADTGSPSGYTGPIHGRIGDDATVAVVETLSVAVEVPLPGVTLDGVNEQVLWAGSPEHEKDIGLLNAPLTAATATENCAVWPRVTVAVLPGAVSAKSGVTTKLKERL